MTYLTIPQKELLKIREEKTYSNIIRSTRNNNIIGYLRGNKSWWKDFKGTTFYSDTRLFTTFENHKGVSERLNLTEINLDEYSLIHLDLNGKTVNRFGVKKKKINYPDTRKPVNAYEITTPAGVVLVITNLKEYAEKHDLLPNKLSEAGTTGRAYKGYRVSKLNTK